MGFDVVCTTWKGIDIPNACWSRHRGTLSRSMTGVLESDLPVLLGREIRRMAGNSVLVPYDDRSSTNPVLYRQIMVPPCNDWPRRLKS